MFVQGLCLSLFTKCLQTLFSTQTVKAVTFLLSVSVYFHHTVMQMLLKGLCVYRIYKEEADIWGKTLSCQE